jgi:hypothetical protein
MSAPSAAVPTRHSPGLVIAPPPSTFASLAVPPLLSYPHLIPSVIRRPSFNPAIHLRSNIFSKVVHPYDPEAFRHFLVKHSLLGAYPDILQLLREGFPIGTMPPLDSLNILENHVSAREHGDIISEYLADEVAAGRLTLLLPKKILRGPFQASPLIVAIQPQAPGEPDKIRVCRHLSKSRGAIASINSFIKQTQFPTRFDTVTRVAKLVSPLCSLSLPLHMAVYHQLAHMSSSTTSCVSSTWALTHTYFYARG